MFKDKRKYAIQFIRPYTGLFILLFILVLITTFGGVFYPYLFGRLIDQVFYGKDMSIFLNIILIYAGIYTFNQIMHFILNITWAQLMTKFLFDIKEALFKKALSFKGEKLSGDYNGDMVKRINEETEQFMDFIHVNVFYFIAGALNLIITIIFIWYLNMWIAIGTIILTPIVVCISRYYAQKAKKFYLKITKQNGFLSAWLYEIMSQLQNLRLLGAAKHILSDYVGKTIKVMRWQIKSEKVELTSERTSSGISLIAQMILYGLAAIFIFHNQLSLGDFTACVAYFGVCVSVFAKLNSKVVAISNNMVSIDRVCDVFTEETEDYNTSAPDIEIQNGSISFLDVHFAYNNDIEVLKGINLTIKSREKIAIVGRSGEGKSTIVNLLNRLYTNTSGEILIDGININDFNLYNLRDQVGIVHQDAVLFNETVRFNLIYTDCSSNDDMLWETLKKVDLYDLIKSLPNGLDTQIGDNGIQFSGGQNKRIAVARILVKNPKILIFDEATSSLDAESEGIINMAMDKLCDSRTIIIIAHRLSTILHANNVAMLENGIIKGYNSHQYLIKNCPEYIELFKEQYDLDKEKSDD